MAVPGWVPALFCERRLPLFDLHAGITSFEWLIRGHVRVSKAQQFVSLLAVRLRMTAADLVCMVQMFDTCVQLHRSLLEECAVRRLLLSCSILAVKVNSDAVVTLHRCWERLEEVLTGLKGVHELRSLESQALKVLDWRVPMRGQPRMLETYRAYANMLFDATNEVAATDNSMAAPAY